VGSGERVRVGRECECGGAGGESAGGERCRWGESASGRECESAGGERVQVRRWYRWGDGASGERAQVGEGVDRRGCR
jgi:hypothetical protein